jgi:hypothetical protein
VQLQHLLLLESSGSSPRKLSSSQPDFGAAGGNRRPPQPALSTSALLTDSRHPADPIHSSTIIADSSSIAHQQQLYHGRFAEQMLAAQTAADVERILQHPELRKPFQHFLEQQFCSENLHFYLAVEEYRKVPDVERSSIAKSIFERHFTPNSIEPVNIDNSTAKTIKEAVMCGQFGGDLYDVAQYQIFHLLKYDCWPRFLQWQAKFASQTPASTSAGTLDDDE